MPSAEESLTLLISFIKHLGVKPQPDYNRIAVDIGVAADSKNPTNAVRVRLHRLFAEHGMTASGEAKAETPKKHGRKRVQAIKGEEEEAEAEAKAEEEGEEGEGAAGSLESASTPSKRRKRVAKTT